MANGRVEMAVREVKRQCRTLRISAEQNTSVRIADDSPLLSWLPRFAAQVMNKLRIDKDGKTSELRRTGRRWTKLMAQFAEKVWFRKIGEDGVSSFATRMIQGIFFGHHDRTGAGSCINKYGVVRGKSWTRQTQSDAWRSTNWEGLRGTPWQKVAPELKLTKKVTADKEGAGPPLPRIVAERTPEVEPRRFYVLSADIEAHGHTGGCPGCAALASHGKATEPHNDECRERVRTIIERTLTGKARMNAYKDRIAETERVKERKRARVERGAGDVPMEPGNRADEQVVVRHADASGGDIRENPTRRGQNERHPRWQGPEAAGEEQPDKLRKTARFEQEAPSAAASSDPTVALEYPASCETQDRPGSVLVLESGHVDDDILISALDAAFYGMDGCKSRYIGEVLDWYRGEDAGDLKRSESNELVENLTCLNALEGKFGKVIRMS